MASRWNANQRSASRASDHTSASPSSPQTTRPSPSIYSTFPETAPLDDSGAKYILSVMVLYLRQTTSYEVPLMLNTPSTDLSFRDFDLRDTVKLEDYDNGHSLRSQPSSSSVRSMNSLPIVRRGYEKTHLSLVKNAGAISNLIAKYTGRIIFHISTTNWGVVHARLKNKIRFLASHPDDNPDTVDIQLMAHSLLDRTRLVGLLGGMYIHRPSKVLTLMVYRSFLPPVAFQQGRATGHCNFAKISHLELD